MATIPAFVTVELDAYQRVAENEQRENLTALELAAFIQSRLPIDKTLSAIAKKLGKSLTIVSQHNSLNDAPDAIRAALDSGRLTSARTANDLMALYKTHDSKALDKHITGMDHIGRGDIESIKQNAPVLSRQRLKKKQKTKPPKKPTFKHCEKTDTVTMTVGGKTKIYVLQG